MYYTKCPDDDILIRLKLVPSLNTQLWDCYCPSIDKN